MKTFLWLIRKHGCPTQRAADTATPWASRGGLSGKNVLPAAVMDGAAVPLTPSLGKGQRRKAL